MKPIELVCGILCVPLAVWSAVDSGGVVVKLELGGAGAAVAAELLERFKLQVSVAPGGETSPLALRVVLPLSGPRAWPAADVEVRDAAGNALPVSRAGIEWHNLSFTVPAVPAKYFVQAVQPAQLNTLPSERERVILDEATGVRLSIAKWHGARKAALSIRFDDSHPTHLTKAIPILREFGFRGTFMVNPGANVPGSRRRSEFQARQKEWEAVAREGEHELANHSAHHRGAIGDDDMEAEIGTAAQAIWDLTPGRSKLMALNLGGGTRWETTRTLRYYLDKYHQFDASQNSTGMDDTYGNRVENFRRILEQHLARGLWCRIHYHAIGDGLNSSEANFRAALEVAKTHQAELWIAGMADIHKYQTERNAAKLSLLRSGPRGLSFQLVCLTDPALYDQNLTIEVLVTPALANRVSARDGSGATLSAQTARSEDAAVLRFDVAPVDARYSVEFSP